MPQAAAAAALTLLAALAAVADGQQGFNPALLRLGQPIRKLGDVFLVPVFEPSRDVDQEIGTNEIDAGVAPAPGFGRFMHALGGDSRSPPETFAQYPQAQQYQLAPPTTQQDLPQQQMGPLRRQRRSARPGYGGYGGGGGCRSCGGGGGGYYPQGGGGIGGGGGGGYSQSQAQASASSSSSAQGNGRGGGYGRK